MPDTINNSVRYGNPQEKNETEQNTARNNIGIVEPYLDENGTLHFFG